MIIRVEWHLLKKQPFVFFEKMTGMALDFESLNLPPNVRDRSRESYRSRASCKTGNYLSQTP